MSDARPWDVGGWLRGLGLGQYEATFRENAVDVDILGDLTDQDLEQLGVLLGHRRKLLRAIAALDGALAPASPTAAPPPVTSAPMSAAVASPTPAAVETPGERRHVTVMFCDLAASTGVATEEWRDLVGAYLDAASKAVTEMGGKVPRKLSNGLMAVFGYPVAQENDLECAAHAALAIQRSLTELNRKNDGTGKPAVAARITIDSGPVVFDATGKTFDEVPNITARAQSLAELRTVLTTWAPRQIPGPFGAEERNSYELKGMSKVVMPYGIVPATGSGHPMTQYCQLIARAVEGLDRDTGEARRALYERARKALVAQLRANQPAFLAADITKERLALEEAIRKVEAEAARKSRTALMEPRSATPPVGTADDNAQVASDRPRRDRAKPPSVDLSGGYQSEDKQTVMRLPVRHRLTAPEEEYNGARLPVSNRGSRANWSRPLPQPLIVSGVMTVGTLNDARVLVERHLTAESRVKDMWRYVSSELGEAARGNDPANFSSVLQMALSLEGLEWSLV